MSLSIPISNPGAESGALNGWNGYGYSAVNNSAQAHTGSYYFGLDASLLSVDSLDMYYASLLQTIDLSHYLGRIENLSVSSWYKDSDLMLHLENFGTGTTISYQLAQIIHVDTIDINGTRRFPTGFGTYHSEEWAHRTGDLSFWGEHWDTYKKDITSVTIGLDSHFQNIDPSGDDIYSLDISSFDNVYFEWASTKYPTYHISQNLSTFLDSEDLPIVGYDDVALNLELAPVPLPSALWLFISAAMGLNLFRKKA